MKGVQVYFRPAGSRRIRYDATTQNGRLKPRESLQHFMTKTCICCHKPYSATAPNQRVCGVSCRRLRYAELERKRYHPRYHGLSSERYEELKALGCAICGEPFTDIPHVDHDHRHCNKKIGCKECVRGLLCRFCNNGLVYAVESNPTLRRLVAPSVLQYIDQFNEKRR